MIPYSVVLQRKIEALRAAGRTKGYIKAYEKRLQAALFNERQLDMFGGVECAPFRFAYTGQSVLKHDFTDIPF